MPKKTEQSAFFSKVKKNTKATWKNARKVKPTPIGQGLPPNLKNAVAVFTEYKLAESKKGDPYVSLTGLVTEPENCVGRRVTRTYYLADGDYATAAQSLEKMAREAKLMGAELDEATEEDWPDIFEEMVAAKCKYVFNTGEYNGKTTIMIQGPVEEDEDDKSEDEEVVEDDDEETEEEEELETPESGDAVNYKPPRKRKAMEMAVTDVDEDEQTVSLVDENEKVYKNVPWSKIEFVEE